MTDIWNHNDISAMVPYKLVAAHSPAVPIGWAVQIDTKSETLFALAGINQKAENLLAASPMMYQALGRIAGVMQGNIDALQDAIDQKQIPEEVFGPTVDLYRAIENDCLTTMNTVKFGIDATVKSHKYQEGKKPK